MQPRVIIVGAGPVGLMTAIQTKLYNPKTPILMLEKYYVYQRKHLLSLDSHSFAETHKDPLFQGMLKKIPSRVKTDHLENALLNFAASLGIQIEYTTVTDCKELMTKYPQAKIIVGADGSHSVVHKQMFAGKYQIKRTEKYIAEIKYFAQGKTLALNTLSQVTPALTYTNHLVSEYVGKPMRAQHPSQFAFSLSKTPMKK